ncbi:MAG TPA: DUF4351 domain-containing protein [Thermoanaerobaculia bacterium]|nr:DUF4351 domain-containing protein [Thermoanaerobaculia bacterium]
MRGGHDQLFKDLLRSFPSDFLRLAAPALARRLVLEGLELHPAEGFLDLPRGAQSRPDLVARAEVREGGPEAVLLHVEVELRFRASVPGRLWRYNRMLHLRHDLPVHSFVLYLHGGPPGVARSALRESSLGREVTCFRYTSFGLGRAPAAHYLARSYPLGWALAALMRWPTSDRDEHSSACLRRIAEAHGLDPARRFLLFNCVATYLEWDGSAAEIQALLHGGQEKQAMITWAEKIEAKAEERGLQQGMRELLLQMLTTRFGPLPSDVREHLAAIHSTEELSLLGRRLLSAGSLGELGIA